MYLNLYFHVFIIFNITTDHTQEVIVLNIISDFTGNLTDKFGSGDFSYKCCQGGYHIDKLSDVI